MKILRPVTIGQYEHPLSDVVEAARTTWAAQHELRHEGKVHTSPVVAADPDTGKFSARKGKANTVFDLPNERAT